MAVIAAKSNTQRATVSDRRNHMALRLLVMPQDEVAKMAPLSKRASPGDEPGMPTNVTEDPFTSLGHLGKIINPPFNLLSLAMMQEQSTELTPLIETMETNIEGFGHALTPRIDLKKVTDETLRETFRTEVIAEKVRLTNFFNYANIKISWIELRRRTRRDLEATGNAFWEVLRSASGQIQGFELLPSFQMRLGVMEEKPIKVNVPVLELQIDGSWKVEQLECWQKYRKFVQSTLAPFRGLIATAGGHKMRWFKEFGDPRAYDNQTGEEIPPDKVDAFMDRWGVGRLANEVVHFKLYSCRSPYGLPRYIGNLLSIFGARAAEEINYITFRNNNVPSMAILVSNGQLTEGTLQRINSFVESQIQGNDNYSKFLLIEAEGDLEGEDAGNIKLDIKPLTREQARDALFQNYMAANQDNVRRAFRIPPIFVGKSDDYTRATAEASRRLADEQVFAPERTTFDEWVNRTLFPHMNVVYHRFRSNNPNTTDNAQLVKILASAEKTGAMTPEIGRMMIEEILSRELPPFPSGDESKTFGVDFDPRLPFSLIMAQAVKNQAQPTEPGQQVTAIKLLEKHLADVHGEDFDPDDSLAELLMPFVAKMRKKLEAKYESMVSESTDDGSI